MTAPALPLTCYLTNKCKKSTKDRELKAQYGNGFAQHAPDGLNTSVDVWELIYKPLDAVNITAPETSPDLTVIQDFLSTVGTSEWFTWTPFAETTSKKWRRVASTLKEEIFTFDQLIISFTIEQCFDLGT